MGKQALTLDETRDMLAYVAAEMQRNQDLLSEADRAIGDGDHGIGMARGFCAVGRVLGERSFAGVGALYDAVGMTLLTSVGGASGAIFGTLFRAGAASLKEQQTFDSSALSRLLLDGLAGVTARGKARVGDKTMVDVLEPAARCCAELTETCQGEVLAAVTEAAKVGMASTKDMLAAVGRARSLGERARGHVDPGAVSLYLILRSMSMYVTQLEQSVGPA